MIFCARATRGRGLLSLDARSKGQPRPLLKQLVCFAYLISFIQRKNQTNQKNQITVFGWRFSTIRFYWRHSARMTLVG
jgi:hypothetical protein